MKQMLSKQLQDQIEQESNDRAEGWQDKMKSQIAKTEYELGAEKYAALYETAIARAERAEKALRQIQDEAGNPDECSDDWYAARLWNIVNFCKETLTPKTGEDDKAG